MHRKFDERCREAARTAEFGLDERQWWQEQPLQDFWRNPALHDNVMTVYKSMVFVQNEMAREAEGEGRSRETLGWMGWIRKKARNMWERWFGA